MWRAACNLKCCLTFATLYGYLTLHQFLTFVVSINYEMMGEYRVVRLIINIDSVKTCRFDMNCGYCNFFTHSSEASGCGAESWHQTRTTRA